ncbi:hypothetical protein LEMLEM_LOCUS27904, partial [Lemmus lemmus]
RLRSPAPSSLATRRAQATSRGTGFGARRVERAPARSGFVADRDADGSCSLQISTPAQAERTQTGFEFRAMLLPRPPGSWNRRRAPPRGALVAVLMVGHSGIISYPILLRRPLGSEWVRELLRGHHPDPSPPSQNAQDGTGPRRMLTVDPHLHAVLGTSPAAVQHLFGYYACSVVKSCAPPEHHHPPLQLLPVHSAATLPVKKLPAAVENPAE